MRDKDTHLIEEQYNIILEQQDDVVVVTNQDEWDNLDKQSGKTVHIKVIKRFNIREQGNLRIIVKETGSWYVSIYNDVFVIGENESVISLFNNSIGFAKDNTRIVGWHNSIIYAEDNAEVEAFDNVYVEASDNVEVELHGNSKVELSGNAKIMRDLRK